MKRTSRCISCAGSIPGNGWWFLKHRKVFVRYWTNTRVTYFGVKLRIRFGDTNYVGCLCINDPPVSQEQPRATHINDYQRYLKDITLLVW